MKTKVKEYWRNDSRYISVSGARKIGFWRAFKDFMRKVWTATLILVILACTHFSVWNLAQMNMPKEDRLVTITEKGGLPPVMQRIASAESMNSHWCTEKLVEHRMCEKSEIGQVLVGINVQKSGRKSTDVGRFQINSDLWGAQATELGYNLYNEKDNVEMALWIYAHYGTDPWFSSKGKNGW